MKRLFLAMVLALVLGCSAGAPGVVVNTPPPCEVTVLQTELFKTKDGGLFGISWLDENCDNSCDIAGVVQVFMDEGNGQPVFIPIGMLTCEQADDFLEKAKKAKSI